MSSAGRLPILAVEVDAAVNSIPKLADPAYDISVALTGDVNGIEVINNLGATVELLINGTVLMFSPGAVGIMVTQQRQAAYLPKGSKFSVRAIGSSAITSGTITINLWG